MARKAVLIALPIVMFLAPPCLAYTAGKNEAYYVVPINSRHNQDVCRKIVTKHSAQKPCELPPLSIAIGSGLGGG